MLYHELYAKVEALGAAPVLFNFLRDQIEADHGDIQEVKLYPVHYEQPTGEAYYRLEDDRTSGYNDEYLVANIVFCQSLLSEPRQYRFALTKELMHVFDTPEEQVTSREQVIQFFTEIQNKPLWQHATAAYKSEIDTQWKALLMLCPKNVRDQLLVDYRAGEITEADVAQRFEIPEELVMALMDEYYDEVFETLIVGPRKAALHAVASGR